MDEERPGNTGAEFVLDKMAQLRTCWKNGGSMLVLVKYQKEEKITEKTEEKIFQCNRNAYMGEQTQKNKWEIYRSITGRYKQPDICKNIFNASIAGLC